MTRKTPHSPNHACTSSCHHHPGRHHWRVQRLSALVLLPLVAWFLISILSFPAFDRETLLNWLSQPVSGSLFLATMTVMIYHSFLGLQVVIDDYVHTPTRHCVAMMSARGAALLTFVATLSSCLSQMVF